MIDVSIIVPSFNEEAIIETTLTKVAAYINDNDWLGECEVIVVAAGSDKTAEIARSLRGKFKHLHIVEPSRASGKGRDVRVGFEHAHGAVQLFMDADLSTPMHHIKRMVSLLRDGIDVVIGERNLAKIHPGAGRSALSHAGPLASRIILGLKWKDTQCGFKGFRADAAQKIFSEMTTNGWGFDLELLVRAKEGKLKVQSIPVNDWDEGRAEGFRGDSVGVVALRTLRELLTIRAASWSRFLARHASALIFFASVAAGVIAACRNLAQSIWFDEAFTTGLINRSVHGLIQGTAHDVHPPLFYLVLKLWAGAFGHSIVTLRMFSVLCGAAAVFFGLRLVKRLFGARAAVWAVPFAVLAPFLLRYDIEARMYAMASLIGIGATYVLVMAMERTRAKQRSFWLWAAYAVLVAMGVYTLYYTALIWVAHFVWCAVLFRRDRKKLRTIIRQPWLLALIASVVLYLPWLPTFLHQAHNIQNGFWIGKPSVNTIVSAFSLAFSWQANWQLSTWESLLFMLAAIAAVYFVVQAWRAVKQPQRTYLLLFALYALVPFAVLYAASLPPFQPVFDTRYVSQTIISGYLLVGVAAAIVCKARPSVTHFAAAAVVVFALFEGTLTLQTVGNYNFDTVSKPSAKQVMNYLYGQNAEDGTVLAQTSEIYLELHYYAPNAPWLRPTVTNVVRLALGQVRQPRTMPRTRTVWYVYSSQFPSGNLTPQLPYHAVNYYNIPNGYHVATYVRS
ncbi:MAG TPA: glycosyltransferase [Candidatus Saccharimonadales bacterium]